MRREFFIAIALGFLLASCSTGSSDPVDDEAPSVLYTWPADAETDVAVDESLTVVFSEPMDHASVEANFIVQDPLGAALDASFRWEADLVVHLDTDLPATLSTDFAATVGADASDHAGNAMAADHEWVFRSREGLWALADDPLPKGSSDGGHQPALGVDAEGNVIVVYIAAVADQWSAVASHLDPEVGWGAPLPLETDDMIGAVTSQPPQLAASPDGEAIAIWVMNTAPADILYFNRYLPGSGWSGPAPVPNAGHGGDVEHARLGVDAEGNAVAVWEEWDGTHFGVWASRFVPGTGWGTVEHLDTTDFPALEPDVAVDAAGNATAIWREYDDASAVYRLCASRYQPGDGWSACEHIEQTGLGSVAAYTIETDASGNSLCLWTQEDAGVHHPWASQHVPDSGWSAAERIDAESSDVASNLTLAFDPVGNALALWQRAGAGGLINVWTNRFDADDGWGTAETVDAAAAYHASMPRVAIDRSGNGFAVWQQHNASGYTTLTARRYEPMSGWVAEEKIEFNDGAHANEQEVVMDALGVATVVWDQGNYADRGLQSNRFE